MIIIFTIIALLLCALFIGKIYNSVQFRNQVERLFSLSKNSSYQIYQHQQIIDLPEPVQRYFRHVLKDGQTKISYARITHNGKFKTGLDKEWINIQGEQYATTETPGFIWKGSTSMFTARDLYIADKGRLVVTLFSLFNVVNGKGEQYDQGELLRWLGESVLYPTNLLPSNRLKWHVIDKNKAKLTFDYKGLFLFFIISFNQLGEITEMETKRYMDEKNLETWVIKLAHYKEINEVLVPTNFEVLWRLKKGDFSYAKFNLQKIEYNLPQQFYKIF